MYSDTVTSFCTHANQILRRSTEEVSGVVDVNRVEIVRGRHCGVG